MHEDFCRPSTSHPAFWLKEKGPRSRQPWLHQHHSMTSCSSPSPLMVLSTEESCLHHRLISKIVQERFGRTSTSHGAVTVDAGILVLNSSEGALMVCFVIEWGGLRHELRFFHHEITFFSGSSMNTLCHPSHFG